MANDARVEVRDLAVSFPLYHGSGRSLKKTVFNVASGRLAKDRQDRIVVRALQGISLSLRTGDRLGLIGANGAGKTTLLRALAGIYEPVGGSIDIHGSISALLDTNLGMNIDLTGRENIRMRGLYNGVPRAELAALEEDVGAFAELGDFLDLPIHIYSAGMIIRLGFALATAIRPQILLMDEWFLAGDAAFLEKARHRLEEMVRRSEILVLSSHQIDIMRTWCDRVLWLDQGRVVADGPAQEVLDRYVAHAAAPPAPAGKGDVDAGARADDAGAARPG